jgi:hypothetical protein
VPVLVDRKVAVPRLMPAFKLAVSASGPRPHSRPRRDTTHVPHASGRSPSVWSVSGSSSTTAICVRRLAEMRYDPKQASARNSASTTQRRPLRAPRSRQSRSSSLRCGRSDLTLGPRRCSRLDIGGGYASANPGREVVTFHLRQEQTVVMGHVVWQQPSNDSGFAGFAERSIIVRSTGGGLSRATCCWRLAPS